MLDKLFQRENFQITLCIFKKSKSKKNVFNNKTTFYNLTKKNILQQQYLLRIIY